MWPNKGWHCRWPWVAFEVHFRYYRYKRFRWLCLKNTTYMMHKSITTVRHHMWAISSTVIFNRKLMFPCNFWAKCCAFYWSQQLWTTLMQHHSLQQVELASVYSRLGTYRYLALAGTSFVSAKCKNEVRSDVSTSIRLSAMTWMASSRPNTLKS